jgi:hypothetical protein
MYFSTRESILQSILESISTREASTSFFSKVISSSRFLFICQFLHFEDNERVDHIKPTNQIAKIQTVLAFDRLKREKLQKKMKKMGIREN